MAVIVVMELFLLTNFLFIFILLNLIILILLQKAFVIIYNQVRRNSISITFLTNTTV